LTEKSWQARALRVLQHRNEIAVSTIHYRRFQGEL
jgi:hypothetical protein